MPNKFADSHHGQSLCLQFEYAHHLNAREFNGYWFFFFGGGGGGLKALNAPTST